MFMVASSITTVKLYVGMPSERSRMRSSSSAFSMLILPLIKSSKEVTPVSGMRNLTTRPGPGPRPLFLHVPSYFGFLPSLRALLRFFSRSSGVQPHQ